MLVSKQDKKSAQKLPKNHPNFFYAIELPPWPPESLELGEVDAALHPHADVPRDRVLKTEAIFCDLWRSLVENKLKTG